MKWYVIVGLIISGLLLQGWGVRGNCPTRVPASRPINYYLQAQATQPQTNPSARAGTNPAQGCPIQWQFTGAAPTGNGGVVQFGFNSAGQWSVSFSFGGQVQTTPTAS